jgi:hypothetical protein
LSSQRIDGVVTTTRHGIVVSDIVAASNGSSKWIQIAIAAQVHGEIIHGPICTLVVGFSTTTLYSIGSDGWVVTFTIPGRIFAAKLLRVSIEEGIVNIPRGNKRSIVTVRTTAVLESEVKYGWCSTVALINATKRVGIKVRNTRGWIVSITRKNIISTATSKSVV